MAAASRTGRGVVIGTRLQRHENAVVDGPFHVDGTAESLLQARDLAGDVDNGGPGHRIPPRLPGTGIEDSPIRFLNHVAIRNNASFSELLRRSFRCFENHCILIVVHRIDRKADSGNLPIDVFLQDYRDLQILGARPTGSLRISMRPANRATRCTSRIESSTSSMPTSTQLLRTPAHAWSSLSS